MCLNHSKRQKPIILHISLLTQDSSCDLILGIDRITFIIKNKFHSTLEVGADCEYGHKSFQFSYAHSIITLFFSTKTLSLFFKPLIFGWPYDLV